MKSSRYLGILVFMFGMFWGAILSSLVWWSYFIDFPVGVAILAVVITFIALIGITTVASE